jgi:hypothetical protein
MTDEEIREKIIRLEERLTASDLAIKIAREEIDRRLSDMNELRSQINSERGIYITRQEFNAEFKIISNEIYALQKFMWMIAGGLAVLEIVLRYMK